MTSAFLASLHYTEHTQNVQKYQSKFTSLWDSGNYLGLWVKSL